MVKCRITYILILLVSFGFYLFYSDYLSFLALLFTLLLPVFLFILILLASRKLSASLKLDTLSAARSEKILVQITIRNGFFLPLSRVKVKLRVDNILNQTRKEFSLMIPVGAHDAETITWTMYSENCGQICLSMVKLTLYDYFGLFVFSKQSEQSKRVYILPQHQSISPKVDLSKQIQLDSDTYSSSKPGCDSSETFGVRDYSPGDSPRSIHWKLSAKLDHLIIRQFSLPINNSYYLLLEMVKPPEDQDFAQVLDNMIDCVFSLSRFLLINQMYHTIAWYNESLDSLEQMTISNEKDHPLFLKKLLSASCYQKDGMAFQKYLQLYSEKPSSHFFYLTPSGNTSPLRQSIAYLSNDRNTVLQFVSPSFAFTSPLTFHQKACFEKDSILSITGETMKPILDQLVI